MRGASKRLKGFRGLSKRVTSQEDNLAFQNRPFIGARPETPRDYSDPSKVITRSLVCANPELSHLAHQPG
eukprot:COSAG02_NODE_83_length_39665_cov_25.213719_32_plen_70_part_00